MDSTYSLNPNPIPVIPSTPEEHHRRVVVPGIIAIGILAVLGGVYWWSTSSRETPVPAVPVDAQAQLREEIAAILKKSETPATPEEIDNMARRLAESRAETSQEGRDRVAGQLTK